MLSLGLVTPLTILPLCNVYAEVKDKVSKTIITSTNEQNTYYGVFHPNGNTSLEGDYSRNDKWHLDNLVLNVIFSDDFSNFVYFSPKQQTYTIDYLVNHGFITSINFNSSPSYTYIIEGGKHIPWSSAGLTNFPNEWAWYDTRYTPPTPPENEFWSQNLWSSLTCVIEDQNNISFNFNSPVTWQTNDSWSHPSATPGDPYNVSTNLHFNFIDPTSFDKNKLIIPDYDKSFYDTTQSHLYLINVVRNFGKWW